jgi:hypothetical protein
MQVELMRGWVSFLQIEVSGIYAVFRVFDGCHAGLRIPFVEESVRQAKTR